MFNISLRGVTGFLRKAVKKGEQVSQEAKRPVHKTKILTDEGTGVTKFQRMYTNEKGNTYCFSVETRTLEDGTRKTSTKVQGVNEDETFITYADEGIITDREKTLKREKGESILGGDRVTINKKYRDTMSESGRTEIMIKDFDEKNKLRHKDYTLKHHHEPGHLHGTQDSVYTEVPLNHSAKDISGVNPSEHRDYKHSWNGRSNYYYFEDGAETQYSRAVAAREQARINAAKLEEEAKIAAAKAKEEYEASLPIVNTGKVLGIDVHDLQRTEETLTDGTIKRVYTKPGSDKPVIVTEDFGLLHKEWIYGGKTDFLYIKKVGRELYPYMIAKKDGYTFVSRPAKSGGLFEEQYRHDGIKGYKGTKSDAELKIPYKETSEYKNADPSRQAFYDKEVAGGYYNKIWTQSTYSHDTKGPELIEEDKLAKEAFIDLYDLLKPYENKV